MKWSDIDWRKIYRYIVDCIFPPRCSCCYITLQPLELICSECEADLETLRIKKPHVRTLNGRRYRIHAVFEYSNDNAPSTIVKRVKGLGKPFGAMYMGKVIGQKAKRLSKQIDAVTYVPTSRSRTNKNMFDHSEYIAKFAAKELGVKEYMFLKKIKKTKRQHDLSEVDRRTNLKGAFRALDKANGMRILLVDDVTTTGSTLCECAQELYAKGAASVTLMAFSMVKRKH